MKTTLSEGIDKGIIKIDQHSVIDFQEGVVQVAMIAVTLTAALVGIWGLLSLCSGIALGGGVVEMAKCWLGAAGL